MREILRFEFFFNKHQMEVVETELFERKPSKPKEDFKEVGGGGHQLREEDDIWVMRGSQMVEGSKSWGVVMQIPQVYDYLK